ncbi:hypothetical protein PR048_030642 [Dryococelus australis]|uniref:Uncharacterized protein n=1 Tax=Dryococelus australis TaxID=614101 RepID=A0ABQ9GC36_9NEOP|nr:hypothetical protein PR048_030642 [Dryococelus australis]
MSQSAKYSGIYSYVVYGRERGGPMLPPASRSAPPSVKLGRHSITRSAAQSRGLNNSQRHGPSVNAGGLLQPDLPRSPAPHPALTSLGLAVGPIIPLQAYGCVTNQDLRAGEMVVSTQEGRGGGLPIEQCCSHRLILSFVAWQWDHPLIINFKSPDIKEMSLDTQTSELTNGIARCTDRKLRPTSTIASSRRGAPRMRGADSKGHARIVVKKLRTDYRLRGLCSCASKVKKRGSYTGDTNTHAWCLIAPKRRACSVSVVLMRSTLSLRSGAAMGSRKLCGMRACIAWMSEGVPDTMEAASCSSGTRRPYSGPWRCLAPASAAETTPPTPQHTRLYPVHDQAMLVPETRSYRKIRRRCLAQLRSSSLRIALPSINCTFPQKIHVDVRTLLTTCSTRTSTLLLVSRNEPNRLDSPISTALETPDSPQRTATFFPHKVQIIPTGRQPLELYGRVPGDENISKRLGPR